MGLKEFTINLDVGVLAKNKPDAIRKLSSHLYTGGFNYWMGDIEEVTEEKKK